jgi:hypothetical protein
MGEAIGYLIAIALMVLAVVGSISFWTSGAYRKNRPAPTLDGFSETISAPTEQREGDREA